MSEEKPLFDNSPIPPGDHLRELLAERQWTQDELAVITGRSRQQINDIIAGRRGITPEMAVALAAAFNNTPGYWLNLEASYRLAAVDEPRDAIVERARLFDLAPIKDMQKRGWLPATKDMSLMPDALMRFFEVDNLTDPIGFPVATRRASLSNLSPSQRAWCFRARQLARDVIAAPWDQKYADELKAKLRKLAAYRSEASHVADVLVGFGIRFVIVEPLPGSRIDGAAFWLDSASPAIALSIRHDRHDYFWFTLMHEVAHVIHGDALSIDDDLGRDDHTPTLIKDDIERRADENAAAWLVPPADLDSFIRRVAPLYSKQRIIQFAHSIKMHPGIIVGQLQNRGEVGWDAHRTALVKIRDLVTETALTDGWGSTFDGELN